MAKPFEGLNEEQKEAASHINGPCCIVAGPGAGKTSTLVRKVSWAIQNGVDPSEIILFTFTNKAASEIRNRIESFIPQAKSLKMIGTYHSICCKILKRYISYLGYNNNFTIFDGEDSLALITSLCKGTNLNARAIRSYISECKRKMVAYEEAVKFAVGIDEKRAGLYRDYQLRLEESNCLDFDDLILKTVQLLQSFPEIKATLNRRYKYIYADEFHDSAKSDLVLIELLMGESQNLTCILDLDQSIYGFRGANIDEVMAFKNCLEDPQVFILNRNYRSSEMIVKASSSLISRNPVLIEKQLFSQEGEGDQIIYSEAKTPEQEANHVISYIKLMRKPEYNLKYQDIAILSRTTECEKIIENALLTCQIPYVLVGGIAFYGRAEIKDLLCFLKFAYNNYDYEAFKRSIQIPKRGIGKETIEKIRLYAVKHQLDLLTALSEYPIKGKTRQKLDAYTDLIYELRNVYLYVSPEETIHYLLDKLNLLELIATNAKDDDEAQRREENIVRLIELSTSYESTLEMIEQASLHDGTITSNNTEEAEGAVSLMTMHASKGLEYECVIITNCNEGVTPHIRAVSEKDLEEERRIFYVALTRAKHYLFLTRSITTKINGQFRYTKPSRFINEIDKRYLYKNIDRKR